MNQTEAIKALAEWRFGPCNLMTVEDWNGAHAFAKQEYLRLLSANVAAIIQGEISTDGQYRYEPERINRMAVGVTHATIQSLVTGAKEGGE